LDWALFQLNCSTCFDALALTVEVDGALLLPEGNRFALVARGIEEGTLSAVNKDGKSLNLLPAKSFEDDWLICSICISLEWGLRPSV